MKLNKFVTKTQNSIRNKNKSMLIIIKINGAVHLKMLSNKIFL